MTKYVKITLKLDFYLQSWVKNAIFNFTKLFNPYIDSFHVVKIQLTAKTFLCRDSTILTFPRVSDHCNQSKHRHFRPHWQEPLSQSYFLVQQALHCNIRKVEQLQSSFPCCRSRKRCCRLSQNLFQIWDNFRKHSGSHFFPYGNPNKWPKCGWIGHRCWGCGFCSETSPLRLWYLHSKGRERRTLNCHLADLYSIF